MCRWSSLTLLTLPGFVLVLRALWRNSRRDPSVISVGLGDRATQLLSVRASSSHDHAPQLHFMGKFCHQILPSGIISDGSHHQ